MCVLRDLEDNTYEILGVDEDSDLLYDIDDIKSEDIGTVKHIMVQVGLMCVLRDLEDNTYEILGVDEDSDLLYDIDDIKSEDIGTVKHIMVQVGFPAE